MKLNGRSIVVTGAASGIGRACASALASAGAKLGLLDVKAKSLEGVHQELDDSGFFAVSSVCDVSTRVEVESSLEELRSKLGTIDGLVAAAGVSRHGNPLPLDETSEEDWKKVLDVNLMGLVNVARELLPAMKAKQSGTIVTIGSTFGFLAAPQLAPYAASKAAIVQVTRNIARDYGRFGIRANTIVPGWIDTPLLRTDAALAGDFDVVMRSVNERTLLGRLGSPTEIANVCVFLTSDLSSFVTGSTVVVDGGYSVA